MSFIWKNHLKKCQYNGIRGCEKNEELRNIRSVFFSVAYLYSFRLQNSRDIKIHFSFRAVENREKLGYGAYSSFFIYDNDQLFPQIYALSPFSHQIMKLGVAIQCNVICMQENILKIGVIVRK